MNAGTEWAVIEMECDLCAHKWTAVVEVDMIEIVEKEHKLPESLECPKCNNLTKL